MHDLTGPVVLVLGAAAGGLHLLGPAKALTRTTIHTLICISMLVVSLLGLGSPSPFELVIPGWIIGIGAVGAVCTALFRQAILNR